jgi:hypothetical protein
MANRFLREYDIVFLVDGQTPFKYTSENTQDPLHMTFNVTYKTGNGQATMTLKMYNLSDDSKEKLNSNDVHVSLSVGYLDVEQGHERVMHPLFVGTINAPLSTALQGADHVTTFQAESGEVIDDVEINHNFRKGIEYKPLIAEYLEKVSEQVGDMIVLNKKSLESVKLNPKALQKFTSGYPTTGLVRSTLDDMLKLHNLSYTLINTNLHITKKGAPPAGARKYKLDELSGLLDRPLPLANDTYQSQSDARANKGYKLKALLDPQFTPTQVLELSYPEWDDARLFTIDKAIFIGGYESSPWYSILEVLHNPNDQELVKQDDLEIATSRHTKTKNKAAKLRGTI